MTGIVQPLPDDLSLSGSSSLRPLDFTNLLSYNHDPVLSSAAISPAAPIWPRLVSPLCSSRSRLGPDNTHHANDPNTWFSGLSPLFKGSPHVPHQTLSEAEISAVTDALWPMTADPEPTFKHPTHTQSAFTATQSVGTTQLTQSALSSAHPNQSAITCGTVDAALEFAESSTNPIKKTPQPRQEPPAPSLTAHTTATGTPPSDVLPPAASSSATEKRERKPTITRKVSQTLSSIDKAAERRRKNRESSSRCYYNRKRIIETLDRQISAEKTKLTTLYDRALELRHENARLKKDVVTRGIALPTKARSYRGDSAFQLQGYLQLLQSGSYQQQPRK